MEFGFDEGDAFDLEFGMKMKLKMELKLKLPKLMKLMKLMKVMVTWLVMKVMKVMVMKGFGDVMIDGFDDDYWVAQEVMKQKKQEVISSSSWNSFADASRVMFVDLLGVAGGVVLLLLFLVSLLLDLAPEFSWTFFSVFQSYYAPLNAASCYRTWRMPWYNLGMGTGKVSPQCDSLNVF